MLDCNKQRLFYSQLTCINKREGVFIWSNGCKKKRMLPTRVELMISTLLVWRLTNLAIEAFLENKQKRMEYTVQLDAPKTR